jgi:uncharacterized membrane protein
MKTFALSYVFSGIAFVVVDAVWLSIMGGTLYRTQLGDLILPKFLLAPAIVFYLVYPVGIAVFAVGPALQSGSALTALGSGLLLGLVAYGTYNLTNLATLRGWSALVTGADMTWGTTLTGLAALAGYWAVSALGKA